MRDADNCHHLYKLDLARDKYKKCYARVLVRYERRWGKKQGVVVSYWLSRNVGQGEEIVWMRPCQS